MSCHSDDSLHGHDVEFNVSRRELLQAAGAGALLLNWRGGVLAAASDPSPGPLRTPVFNRAPLAVQPYTLLPLGSVKPAGWLRRQLEIQASGMGGRLDETWPDVGPKSGWLGGDGESWERGPYFLDGLLPLAWLLDSAPLKAKAQKFIDWTLSNAQPNGMIGPKSNDDWWPRMVMLKALTQYHEATEDPRVIPVMTNYFRHQLQALPQRALANWGRFRWQDELITVLWLYNRTGDEQLLQLARLLQSQGWNWGAGFEDFQFKEKLTRKEIYKMMGGANPLSDRFMSCHGVNAAMGLKTSAVWSLVSGNKEDRAAIHRHLATLDRYHGLPIGIFSADEHFAGRNPSQGIELCAVVEAMYSLEQALAITGDGVLADRLERLAYNALPATFGDDMWTHQYDQQPNQIECSLELGPWSNNGPEANLFGLEPNFGCCTANFHQGWPKLVASLWMASAEGGLAAMVYAPCEVATEVRGVPVRVRETTDYPFRDQVGITVEPERPLAFALKLRVPGWARGANVTVNTRALPSKTTDGFVIVDRTWRKGDRVEITFDVATHTVPGFNGSVSVVHGPLLFSLPIVERWEKLRERELTADWEVHPGSAWNYGIEADTRFERREQPVPAVPFSNENPPVALAVSARQLPQWKAVGNYAAPPPQSPVSVPGGASETITLIPYGAAKLRITSFPVVES